MSNSRQILVFAGPNGSGKSTISKRFSTVGIYINADNIKSATDCSDLEAAVEAEKLREFCLEKNRDFSFETVLSTERNLLLLERAKQQGYKIESVFVLTIDPELNAYRVRSRVDAGGHDVPVEKIHERYYRSLSLLPRLIKVSSVCVIIDNTDMPTTIYLKDSTGNSIYPSKFWPDSAIRELIGEQK